jgi:hypothetical protein
MVVLSHQPKSVRLQCHRRAQVLNMCLAQVGHLKRSVVATLAPLLDSHLALVEAIVPKPSGWNPKRPSAKLYRISYRIHQKKIVQISL